MSFIKYLKSLLPQFTSDRVTELARINQSELDTLVIPSYLEAEKLFGTRSFTSKSISDMTTIFKRNVTSEGKDNIVVSIRKALERTSANNKILDVKSEDIFESEIVLSGITILKANVIRLLELNSFVSRYSMRFLNYIYILETQATNADPRYVKDSLSLGEIAWLEKNFLDFCYSLKAVSRDTKDMAKTLDNIPDIIIGEDSDSIISTVGEVRSDPFNTKNISGFTNSPIFHARLIVAQFQANRYKEQKALKQLLEMRLLNLRNSQGGNPSAALEKEIDYMQGRVDRLSEELRRAEGE